MAVKEQPAEVSEATAKPKKKLPMTAIIIVGITVVQAAGFFVAFKMFSGGPAPTYGAEAGEGEHHAEGEDPKSEEQTTGTVEFALLEKLRVPNNKAGRLYMYDMDVYVIVAAEKKPEIEKFKTERMAEIADRMGQIVRAADTRALEEDDLRTLRMQMQAALATVVGDKELIQRVLIPRCVPIRAE